jgi:membrane protease YdiL (CAAX protease family)
VNDGNDIGATVGIGFELLISLAVWLALASLGFALLGACMFLVPSCRGRWLPVVRIRRIPWFGFDNLFAFFIFLAIPMLVHATLQQAGFFEWLYAPPAGLAPTASQKDTVTASADAQQKVLLQREFLWTGAVADPLTLALIILGLGALRASRPAHLGLTHTRLGANIRIGFVAWAAVTPVVTAVHAAAEYLTPADLRDAHPVFEASQLELSVTECGLIILMVTLLAPLMEEVIFRGLWLSWQLRGGWEAQAILGAFALLWAAISCFGRTDRPFNPAPLVFVLLLLPVVYVLPFWPRGSQAHGPWWRLQGSALAVFANGLLFGAMHSNVWPSPIALWLLGMALAWVRYRTGSLVGCIVLHSLFNAQQLLVIPIENLFSPGLD